VAGGLGEYFGVDPVLFRVLFAVTAFFGGAGILAYIIAWAAIPERGEPHAPIDRLVGGGRRKSVPAWILTLGAAVVVWGLLFSWWAPWRFLPWMFLPLALAALVLAMALSRRPEELGPEPAVDPAATMPGGPTPNADVAPWITAARAARRERRARIAPMRWAMLGTLIATLALLGLVDAATGVRIPVYFWAVQLVVVAGLVVGAALRRPIWWTALLLIPASIGAFVFSSCRVSLHDGSGANTYTPSRTADLRSDYRHAFGQTTLDLTALGPLDVARTIHVTQAAGQVQLIIPPSLPVDVHANVHLGTITVDGSEDSSGMGLNKDPVTTASGRALTIDVRLTAGELRIDRQN
jgi:phage shock protein PspC (stress-responsive transcriptional regulator)